MYGVRGVKGSDTEPIDDRSHLSLLFLGGVSAPDHGVIGVTGVWGGVVLLLPILELLLRLLELLLPILGLLLLFSAGFILIMNIKDFKIKLSILFENT